MRLSRNCRCDGARVRRPLLRRSDRLPPTTTLVLSRSTAPARRAATPDVANLSLQIETHAATAEESSSKNAALAQKVVQALKDKLAGKGTVTTGDYSLNPEYQRARARASARRLPGYTAQNTITVETTELMLLGSLIDGAISAGANRINYLNFGLRDDTKARARRPSRMPRRMRRRRRKRWPHH